jgi:hypothetical protein
VCVYLPYVAPTPLDRYSHVSRDERSPSIGDRRHTAPSAHPNPGRDRLERPAAADLDPVASSSHKIVIH